MMKMTNIISISSLEELACKHWISYWQPTSIFDFNHYIKAPSPYPYGSVDVCRTCRFEESKSDVFVPSLPPSPIRWLNPVTSSLALQANREPNSVEGRYKISLKREFDEASITVEVAAGTYGAVARAFSLSIILHTYKDCYWSCSRVRAQLTRKEECCLKNCVDDNNQYHQDYLQHYPQHQE